MSPLETLMASIAAFIPCMSAAPLSAAARVCLARSLAFCAFSALRLVMEDISSNDALVSSMDAACSLEPSARVWLAAETWLAALTTCSELEPRPPAMARSETFRRRTMNQTTDTTRAKVAPMPERLNSRL